MCLTIRYNCSSWIEPSDISSYYLSFGLIGFHIHIHLEKIQIIIHGKKIIVEISPFPTPTYLIACTFPCVRLDAIQYFSKPGDTFLSGRRLVLPRLASPGLALPCLVMPCLVLPGFECDAFSSNIKKWDSYGGVVLMRFSRYLQSDYSRLLTIWAKCIYILIFCAKTSFYKRYLLMAWYLVYPMILGYFQIARLMPGKYGGHFADDIFKLILFIKNVV